MARINNKMVFGFFKKNSISKKKKLTSGHI